MFEHAMKDNSRFAVLIERTFIWAGLAMAMFFAVGVWSMAGFIPPPAPSATATEIAARFAGNATGIITGSMFVLIAAALYMPFCIAISEAVDKQAPSLALLGRAQAACAAVNVVFFSLIGLLWIVAAYRSDAPASDVRLFNDLAWMIMVVPTMPFIIQAVCVGVVALAGPQQVEGIPRWLGYFSLWCASLTVPGMFSGFFKTGPIAWNGLLSFWLEVVAFLAWLLVMVFALNRALTLRIGRNVQNPAPGSDPHAHDMLAP